MTFRQAELLSRYGGYVDNSSERLPIDPAKGEAGVAILTGYQAQQEGGDPDAAARAYIDAACEQYASEGGIG